MLDDDSFAEIRQIFIEEADEGLDVMESGLLALTEPGGDRQLDAERINDIFRAAHSIKGGSATFGFAAVVGFTHLVETLLDRMREGRRSPSPDRVQVLLVAVDCLREMMMAVKQGQEVDHQRADEVAGLLQAELAGDGDPKEENARGGRGSDAAGTVDQNEIVATSEQAEPREWQIRFEPAPGILKTGNDPARLLRELATLGELQVEADLRGLPGLDEFDPENCYTAWNLTLHSGCAESEIREIFDWVADECELLISTAAAEVHCEPVLTETAPQVNEPSPPAEQSTETCADASIDASLLSASKKKVLRKEGGSIRVGIDKIDSLLNLVGELVITQAMLNRYGGDDTLDSPAARSSDLREGLAQLEANARELQDVAMKMRMLPIKTTFDRFPRLIHDLSLQLDKKVNLEILGDQTELDKTVLEKIGDPLVHLVRNALDHGLESPEQRISAGKPETGTLTLKASHEAGNIVIEVTDDGAGLDPDKIIAKAIESGLIQENDSVAPEAVPYLIFQPGFSTAQSVSDLSGRGVGMDVVKQNIQDLGGRVEVKSVYGQGSTFTIRLPLTLAILDGQLVKIRDSTYVVPLLSIIETVVLEQSRLSVLAAESMVYRLRDEYIPVIDLAEVLNAKEVGVSSQPERLKKSLSTAALEGKLMVIVESDTRLAGLVVDDLLDQQQVVLKSLEANYQQIQGLAGATILGDGTVALIIDITGIMESCLGGAEVSSLRDIAAA